MSFEHDKYIIARELLSKETCKIAEQYCLFKMLNESETEDHQVPGTHAVYADSLMETLLLHTKPKIEELTGLSLMPTYSYYRVYKPGDVLPDHKDRSACEISATVTLGIRHIGKSDNYRWCLHSYVNGEKRYLECNVGDAVIYKGCEIEHGRDKFDVDEYSYQVQCFLHYVNVNGPTYTEELKYDRRPSIGFKVKETIVNNDTTDC
jgi:hypothetical protein